MPCFQSNLLAVNTIPPPPPPLPTSRSHPQTAHPSLIYHAQNRSVQTSTTPTTPQQTLTSDNIPSEEKRSCTPLKQIHHKLSYHSQKTSEKNSKRNSQKNSSNSIPPRQPPSNPNSTQHATRSSRETMFIRFHTFFCNRTHNHLHAARKNGTTFFLAMLLKGGPESTN